MTNTTAGIDLDTIREVFLRNGFTIKEGQTDLKPYVYAAAQELIQLARRSTSGSAQPLRFTNDGELAECPCCGSLDVGGAHDTVHCYGCGLTVSKPRPLQNAIDAWNRRERAPKASGSDGTAVAVVPDRDIVLEAAVQAIAARAGESDRIDVVSAFDAIRSLKTNRHALPIAAATSGSELAFTNDGREPDWGAYATAEQVGEPASSEDLIAIPRGLIGAACYAVRKLNPESKLLPKLREYTTGAKSAALAQQAATCQPLADERARVHREDDAFTEWWNRAQACPEHNLITENAARATWHERARRTILAHPSPSIDQQGGAPADPIDAYTAPHDHPPLVEIAVRLAKQNREWSGKQIEEAARAEYATVLAAPAPAAQADQNVKDAALFRLAVEKGMQLHFEGGDGEDDAVWVNELMKWSDGDRLGATRALIEQEAKKPYTAMSQAKGAGKEGAA